MSSDQTTGWHSFDQKPTGPMMVEYYYGNGPDFDLPSHRDERRALGFFDGKQFCELGTGHEVFEAWERDEDFPTHWRQAAESPKMSTEQTTETRSIRVRILVAVDRRGHWTACGSSEYADPHEIIYIDDLEDGEDLFIRRS